MKLIFRIQYRTIWGEEVRLIFDEDESQSIALSTRDGIEWQGSCEYQLSPCDAPLTYRYAIYQNNACTRKELGAIAHIIYPGNAQQSCYIIDDCWRDLPEHNYRYSSAFNNKYVPAAPVRLKCRLLHHVSCTLPGIKQSAAVARYHRQLQCAGQLGILPSSPDA